MSMWHRRSQNARAKTCKGCGKVVRRESGLCPECEQEEQRRNADAQRGFSIDLAEYVRIPPALTMSRSGDDAGGGPLPE